MCIGHWEAGDVLSGPGIGLCNIPDLMWAWASFALESSLVYFQCYSLSFPVVCLSIYQSIYLSFFPPTVNSMFLLFFSSSYSPTTLYFFSFCLMFDFFPFHVVLIFLHCLLLKPLCSLPRLFLPSSLSLSFSLSLLSFLSFLVSLVLLRGFHFVLCLWLLLLPTYGIVVSEDKVAGNPRAQIKLSDVFRWTCSDKRRLCRLLLFLFHSGTPFPIPLSKAEPFVPMWFFVCLPLLSSLLLHLVLFLSCYLVCYSPSFPGFHIRGGRDRRIAVWGYLRDIW